LKKKKSFYRGEQSNGAGSWWGKPSNPPGRNFEEITKKVKESTKLESSFSGKKKKGKRKGGPSKNCSS